MLIIVTGALALGVASLLPIIFIIKSQNRRISRIEQNVREVNMTAIEVIKFDSQLCRVFEKFAMISREIQDRDDRNDRRFVAFRPSRRRMG
jgi:hypothetical protein